MATVAVPSPTRGSRECTSSRWALWPVAGMVTTAGAPWPLTPVGATLTSFLLLLLLLVFVVNLRRETAVVGLTERIVAGAMTICPLVLVVSLG